MHCAPYGRLGLLGLSELPVEDLARLVLDRLGLLLGDHLLFLSTAHTRGQSGHYHHSARVCVRVRLKRTMSFSP